MSSQNIFTTEKGAILFAALDWRVLPINLQVDNALREVARDKNAKYAVKVTSQLEEEVTLKNKTIKVKRATAGLWNEGVDETKPPSKAHSFAACFALSVLGNHHHNVICNFLLDVF